MPSPNQSSERSPPPDVPGESPDRGKSRSRSKSGSGRPRTRSKSGSPDSRARTRSRTGSPKSRSVSRELNVRRRSRSRSRDHRRGSDLRGGGRSPRRGSPKRSPPRRSPPRRGGSPRRHSPRRGSPRRSPPRRTRSRSRSASPDLDGHRLHVADLDSNASKRDIEAVFGRYGSLLEIWMARSVPCFAFVVYRHKEDAYEACRAADGIDICGRRVRVTMARPRTRGRSRRGFDPSMRCYQCGERGHFSRDCPDTKYGYKRPPSPRSGRGYRSRSRSGGRYDRRDRY